MQREELPFDLDLGHFQRWWNPFNLSHDEKINTISTPFSVYLDI
jgi:hypothetical protein